MILGIMGAMPDEVDQLCAKLENVTVEPYGGVEYHKGTLAGKQVVVCCAGMGKANAAATTQVLITKFGAEKIIFSGIAGNMTSKIGIGDVVIGKTVLYHDAQLDMICQNPPFLKEYSGDPALIAAAEAACAEAGVKALVGKIATGDLFVGDSETKAAIEAKCAPDCVEMEGAAIAHVAFAAGKPCLVIRTMSDCADDEADVGTDAFRNEVLVQGGGREEHRDRHAVSRHGAVRDDEDVVAALYGVNGLSAKRRDLSLNTLAPPVHGVRDIELTAPELPVRERRDVVQFRHIAFGQDRLHHLKTPGRIDVIHVKEIRLRADKGDEARHELLTDRVDRRVRDLSEELLKVVKERLIFLR